MNNFALHMRISSVDVSDNDVESRLAAVASLATYWKRDKNPTSIVSTAANIAQALGGDGVPSSELGTRVQTAIQKKSPAYLYEERPLDVGICAGMAMVSILSGSHSGHGWTNADVYAAALWSALSYQPILEDGRRETLRREVLTTAMDWSKISADKARERAYIPELTDLEINIIDANNATSNLKEVMTNTIEPLSRNAALDREELDFLWWAQLGRSRLIKKQLSEINEPTRIVAAGIEGAKMLRRFPCEVHREITLRTLNQNPELDLAELLDAIGDDRNVLRPEFNNDNALASPVIFPLLHALSTGEAVETGASVKRPVSEWGERALLEATFARLISQGASKI